jgi:type IV secretion system protein VirB1
VNGRLLRQPHSLEEAIATAISLEISGFDYSVGCRQVNRKNFSAYRLSLANAFDPKANSEVGSQIYRECLTRANRRFGTSGAAIRAALSCYYSGNFTTGQRKEGNQPSYVDKVLANMRPGQQSAEALAIPIIPRKSGVVARHQLSHDHSVPVPRPEAKKKKAEWDAFDEL